MSVHKWDRTGEHCVKCGDPDWSAGAHCDESLIKAKTPNKEINMNADFMKALEEVAHSEMVERGNYEPPLLDYGDKVVLLEDLRALLSGDGAYRVVPVEFVEKVVEADKATNLYTEKKLISEAAAMIATDQGV